MIRSDLEYSVCNGLRIERMTATFCRRLDDSATLIQVLLGMSVFADVASLKVVGTGVIFLSVWIWVFKPGPKAILAAQQQRRYEALSLRMARLSDVELEAELIKIGDTDTQELEFICLAAENAGHRNVGSPEPHKIKWWQSMLLFVAGS